MARVTAVAQVRSLAWELVHIVGVAKKNSFAMLALWIHVSSSPGLAVPWDCQKLHTHSCPESGDGADRALLCTKNPGSAIEICPWVTPITLLGLVSPAVK